MAIKDNLIAYWNMSEASGTRNDSTANVEHLTDQNTVTGTTGPGSNNASLFTRANVEALTHADDANLSVDASDFSMTGWFKYTTLNDYQGIVAHGISTGNTRSWALYFSETASPTMWFAIFSNGTTTTSGVLNPSGPFTTGVWYFVYISRRASDGQIKLSIDDGTVLTSTAATMYSTAQTFGFGWREDPALNNLNGALAMWGLWKRILTATEITFLYNSGNGIAYAELDPALAITPTVATASISGIASRNNYGLITPTMTKI